MILQLDKIEELIIEPTSYCNLHCPQCPRFNDEGYLTQGLTPKHLDPVKLKENLDLNLLTSLKRIKIEGDYGDIMMHPNPQEFFEIFKNYPTNVITNGSIRSTNFWSELAKFPNLSITFSIDGLEDTNSIYRINSNWNVIIDNAKAYIQAGGKAKWKFIVFQHNQHQIDEAKKFSQELRFTDFEVEHSDRSWFTGSVWPVKVDGKFLYNISVSDKVELKQGYTERPTASLVQKKIENLTDITSECWPLKRRSLYINHLGHVLPCCMSSGLTWKKDLSARIWQGLIGNLDSINLYVNPLSKIAQSDFYTNKLESTLQGTRRHPLCLTYCS